MTGTIMLETLEMTVEKLLNSPPFYGVMCKIRESGNRPACCISDLPSCSSCESAARDHRKVNQFLNLSPSQTFVCEGSGRVTTITNTRRLRSDGDNGGEISWS